METTFDLGLEEMFVTLGINGLRLTHVFRRPTEDELTAHQGGLIARTRTRDGKTIESEFDSSDADFRLWQAVSVRVEGYVHSRYGDLSKLDEWKKLVPPAHQQAAVQALYNLELDPEAVAGAAVHFDTALTVALKCTQNRVPCRLKHRFRDATTSELKEWKRVHSAPREVNQRGAIVSDYSVKLGQITKLYDVMITGIEGYAFQGSPLASAEDARAVMDVIHKKVAVQEAFRRLTEVDDSEGGSPLA